MSDPADKSDDLIAELAKLMATPPQGDATVRSVRPVAPAASNPNPTPTIRIPGMDAPVPAKPAPVANVTAPAPQAEPRSAATGSIRIPGMEQPASVPTTPISRFDFGKPVAAAPIKQEPLSTLAERLAPQNPMNTTPQRVEPNLSPAPQPVRAPADLKPADDKAAPQAAQTPSAETQGEEPDFTFDFGFGQNPPQSSSPPRPQPDPIAALIEQEMADAPSDEPEVESEANAESEVVHPEPAPVAATPRPAIAQPAAARPMMTPVAPVNARSVAAAPIPLKAVNVRPVESDRFAVSPGSAFGSKSAPAQPVKATNAQSFAFPSAKAPLAPSRAPEVVTEAEPHAEGAAFDTDPMAEIESLIGEAVRVELAVPATARGPGAPAIVAPDVELEPEAEVEAEIHPEPYVASAPPQTAPIVPPLTTNFAPRRSGLKDDGVSGAEAAILAASADAGEMPADRMAPVVGEDSPYRRTKVRPPRETRSGGMRQYLGMALAGVLLLVAGLGLYWVLNMGRASTVTGTTAPQLTADATPVKQKPAAKPADESETAKSPVLQQMGGTSQAPSSEQLVSTDETAGTTPAARDVTPVAAADDSESGLANRKVRTVTVRPDGTIVSGDDAVAGTEELPVERPNVPSVPSTETTNLLDNTEVAAINPLPSGDVTGTPAAATTADPGTASAALAPTIDPNAVAPSVLPRPVRVASATPATTTPAATTTTTPAVKTPATTAKKPTNPVNAVLSGAQTPNGQIDLLGGTSAPTQKIASANPTPAPTASSGGAGAYVQIASSNSAGEASAAVKSATSKYGSLFGGNQLTVQKADLGQKGVRYRVRLPTSSLTEATRICSAIKANGGDCYATGS